MVSYLLFNDVDLFLNCGLTEYSCKFFSSCYLVMRVHMELTRH